MSSKYGTYSKVKSGLLIKSSSLDRSELRNYFTKKKLITSRGVSLVASSMGLVPYILQCDIVILSQGCTPAVYVLYRQ